MGISVLKRNNRALTVLVSAGPMLERCPVNTAGLVFFDVTKEYIVFLRRTERKSRLGGAHFN